MFPNYLAGTAEKGFENPLKMDVRVVKESSDSYMSLCSRPRLEQSAILAVDSMLRFSNSAERCATPLPPENYSLNYFTCIYQHVSASYSVRSFGTDH